MSKSQGPPPDMHYWSGIPRKPANAYWMPHIDVTVASKLVRTRNREILMWVLNMPCFTVEAQCRAGKQLVTKCELTDPLALV